MRSVARGGVALAGLVLSAADLPPDLPRPADVESIMMDFMRCEAEGCPPLPRRAIVRNLRCMPDTEWEFEGRRRVICVFSGRWIGPDVDGLGMDCAYIWRDRDSGRWTFQASPDWDLCEDFEAELADSPIIR